MYKYDATCQVDLQVRVRLALIRIMYRNLIINLFV